jgi:hypothetical protein
MGAVVGDGGAATDTGAPNPRGRQPAVAAGRRVRQHSAEGGSFETSLVADTFRSKAWTGE